MRALLVFLVTALVSGCGSPEHVVVRPLCQNVNGTITVDGDGGVQTGPITTCGFRFDNTNRNNRLLAFDAMGAGNTTINMTIQMVTDISFPGGTLTASKGPFYPSVEYPDRTAVVESYDYSKGQIVKALGGGTVTLDAIEWPAAPEDTAHLSLRVDGVPLANGTTMSASLSADLRYKPRTTCLAMAQQSQIVAQRYACQGANDDPADVAGRCETFVTSIGACSEEYFNYLDCLSDWLDTTTSCNQGPCSIAQCRPYWNGVLRCVGMPLCA